MKRGPDKQNMTAAQNALERVGLLDSNGGSVADALLQSGAFVIPSLPKVGRKSTSMTQAQFFDLVCGILNGLKFSRACKKSGVLVATGKSWLKKGAEDTELGRNTAQAVFMRTVAQAEVLGEEYYSQLMFLHAQKDWRAAHAMLKDRFGLGQEEAAASNKEDKRDIEAERRDRLKSLLPQYAEQPEIIEADEVE